MNLWLWMLLLYPIKFYYQRKWEGKRAGDPLDLKWIRKRIDCSDLERYGAVVSCYFDRRRNAHVFLVDDGANLEWGFYKQSPTDGRWRVIVSD